MSDRERSGSRYLYEPFDANRARIETNEKLLTQRWDALERRLEKLEEQIERVDKRLWVLVYGVVAVVLSRAASSKIA